MKIVKIPKRKKGCFRTIYIPNQTEMSTLRSMSGKLTDKADRFTPEGVSHGFSRGKSPVTNAQSHVGHLYTTCFDLRDFFDSVTPERLKGKLTKEEMALVIVDGAARQGLPTSPAIANMAASEIDKSILRWRDKHKLQFIYTRYADDLSFSYDQEVIRKSLEEEIPKIVKRCGFQINESKTRTMSAKSGRRIITGIAVGENEIHPSRRSKRKLRAAIYQKNKNQENGLTEWCKLKPPRQNPHLEKTDSEMRALQKAWRIKALPVNKLPNKGDEITIGNECIITPDPVYTLGMSTWTTGWTSCHSQPNGQYRSGAIFWTFLRGTRLAVFLSHKKMVVAGVERRQMRARALIHQLRNGVLVYDRIYGNPADIGVLREQLEGFGVISTVKAREKHGGESIVGHAPANWRAYFDTLKSKTSKASSGQWKGRVVRVVHI